MVDVSLLPSDGKEVIYFEFNVQVGGEANAGSNALANAGGGSGSGFHNHGGQGGASGGNFHKFITINF